MIPSCQSTRSAPATPRSSQSLLWTSQPATRKMPSNRTGVRCRLLGERAAYGAVAREQISCRKSGARRLHVRLPLRGGGRMTAEIAILNKAGVALAADSKVTIGGVKTFDTANKIFCLSKFHPVGIMIFGNAEFMGFPWETIVKMYVIINVTVARKVLRNGLSILSSFYLRSRTSRMRISRTILRSY